MPDGPIVVDTNLLVLLVVGLASETYIGRHKRLRKTYSIEDFRLLLDLLSSASEVVVTPHILAETSNLIRYIDDPDKTSIGKTFQALIKRINEQHISGAVAAEHVEFIRLGLTDSGVLDVLAKTRRLATDDLDLYLSALRLGYDAINFSHLRDAAYGGA